MPPRSESNRKANIWVARCIPLILLAVIGYASWVITRLICVNYLINPPLDLYLSRRNGPAIAILVIHYLLMAIVVVTYARLLYIIARRPGLVPRGHQWYIEKESKRHRRRKSGSRQRSMSSSREKANEQEHSRFENPKETEKLATDNLPFKVEDFWRKDVFVCKYDGRPPFCSTCYNWKPDRAHHCSELNRCVMKMDHFCPWVGGVVAETSFKFFIQFTFYAALFCSEVLIVSAVYFAERREREHFFNAHWVVVIALSALFLLFSGGMCLSSGQFAFINSTTIENLNRKSAVWYLAAYIHPRALQEAQEKNIQIRTISYPRPLEEQVQIMRNSGAAVSEVLPQNDVGSSPEETKEYRTFVILETIPGQNPWNVGVLQNFQEIMGITIWEWLLPIHPSPCSQHRDDSSLYALGPAIHDLKRATGIQSWMEDISRPERRRRRSHTSV